MMSDLRENLSAAVLQGHKKKVQLYGMVRKLKSAKALLLMNGYETKHEVEEYVTFISNMLRDFKCHMLQTIEEKISEKADYLEVSREGLIEDIETIDKLCEETSKLLKFNSKDIDKKNGQMMLDAFGEIFSYHEMEPDLDRILKIQFIPFINLSDLRPSSFGTLQSLSPEDASMLSDKSKNGSSPAGDASAQGFSHLKQIQYTPDSSTDNARETAAVCAGDAGQSATHRKTSSRKDSSTSGSSQLGQTGISGSTSGPSQLGQTRISGSSQLGQTKTCLSEKQERSNQSVCEDRTRKAVTDKGNGTKMGSAGTCGKDTGPQRDGTPSVSDAEMLSSPESRPRSMVSTVSSHESMSEESTDKDSWKEWYATDALDQRTSPKSTVCQSGPYKADTYKADASEPGTRSTHTVAPKERTFDDIEDSDEEEVENNQKKSQDTDIAERHKSEEIVDVNGSNIYQHSEEIAHQFGAKIKEKKEKDEAFTPTPPLRKPLKLPRIAKELVSGSTSTSNLIADAVDIRQDETEPSGQSEFTVSCRNSSEDYLNASCGSHKSTISHTSDRNQSPLPSKLTPSETLISEVEISTTSPSSEISIGQNVMYNRQSPTKPRQSPTESLKMLQSKSCSSQQQSPTKSSTPTLKGSTDWNSNAVAFDPTNEHRSKENHNFGSTENKLTANVKTEPFSPAETNSHLPREVQSPLRELKRATSAMSPKRSVPTEESTGGTTDVKIMIESPEKKPKIKEERGDDSQDEPSRIQPVKNTGDQRDTIKAQTSWCKNWLQKTLPPYEAPKEHKNEKESKPALQRLDNNSNISSSQVRSRCSSVTDVNSGEKKIESESLAVPEKENQPGVDAGSGKEKGSGKEPGSYAVSSMEVERPARLQSQTKQLNKYLKSVLTIDEASARPKHKSTGTHSNLGILQQHWLHRKQGLKAHLLTKFGRHKMGEGDGFHYPIGVASNSQGQIIVTDTGNHLIKMYDSAGRYLFTFGQELGMNRPSAVVLNDNDDIFVKDDDCIHAFDKNGKFLRRIGEKTMYKPYGLGITSEGILIVLDTALRNPLLYHFPQDGSTPKSYTYQPLVGIYYTENARMTKCRFLTVIDDTVIVSDLGRSIILITSLEGNLLHVIGRPGCMPGELYEPSGISGDIHGNMVIGDSKNDRVQIFRHDGGYSGYVMFDEPIMRPSGIHLCNDKLYIMCFLLHQVKVYQLGPVT